MRQRKIFQPLLRRSADASLTAEYVDGVLLQWLHGDAAINLRAPPSRDFQIYGAKPFQLHARSRLAQAFYEH